MIIYVQYTYGFIKIETAINKWYAIFAISAPVVQRIGREFPKFQIQVRLLVGALLR